MMPTYRQATAVQNSQNFRKSAPYLGTAFGASPHCRSGYNHALYLYLLQVPGDSGLSHDISLTISALQSEDKGSAAFASPGFELIRVVY